MIPDIASKLDLANHHANATSEDVKKVCADVLNYGFNAAFVNPCYVALVKKTLAGRAKVGTAISFPLGQDTTDIKISASIAAVKDGADELDIVPNNALLLDQNMHTYQTQLTQIVSSIRAVKKEIIIKFILETGDLSALPTRSPTPQELSQGSERIKAGARCILASGADFVKICSGMGRRGASLEDVRLVKEAVGTSPIKIKVAGGIDTLAEATAFLASGASRIGTSKAVEIMKQITPASTASSPQAPQK